MAFVPILADSTAGFSHCLVLPLFKEQRVKVKELGCRLLRQGLEQKLGLVGK